MPEQVEKPDPQDILTIQNIDLDCDEITSNNIFVERQRTDMEGKVHNYKESVSNEFNHTDFFEVRWGNSAIRLMPGEVRRLPRYLGEHYAKHLADHMLMKMEKETNRQFLVNHPIERPKIIKSIIIGVEKIYRDDTVPMSEGERAIAEADRLNEGSSVDAGKVPNTALGELREPPKNPKIKVEDDATPINETSLIDPKKPKPTRAQLMKECAALNIKFEMTDTTEQLIARITNF